MSANARPYPLITQRIVNPAVAAQVRFPIAGLPFGMDVLYMLLCFRIHIDRNTGSAAAVTTQNILDLFSNVRMDAHSETLIQNLPLETLAWLCASEGVLGLLPANAGGAGTDIETGMIIPVPFADERQDENGKALDTAQDSALLMQNGMITIDLTPWNLAVVNTSWIDVTPIFICAPKQGVYVRPFKKYWMQTEVNLADHPLAPGVFFDTMYLGNVAAGQVGLTADLDAMYACQVNGAPLIERQRAIYATTARIVTGIGGMGSLAARLRAGTTRGMTNDLLVVARQLTEVSEISKALYSPKAEWRAQYNVGAITPAVDTVIQKAYCELRPADATHMERVRLTYGIPSDATAVPLGPSDDQYMPLRYK